MGPRGRDICLSLFVLGTAHSGLTRVGMNKVRLRIIFSIENMGNLWSVHLPECEVLIMHCFILGIALFKAFLCVRWCSFCV